MASIKDAVVELLIDGAWTDITTDVCAPTSPLIRITRGVNDENEHASPSQCALTLDNQLGKYSPRNPVGPYYGKIGRNTPLRVSVLNTGVDEGPAFDSYAAFVGTDTVTLGWLHTPVSRVGGVIVFISQNAGITDEVVNVTYGGVLMTEAPNSPLIHSTGAEDGVLYAFFLGEFIPQGPQPIFVNVNGTGSVKHAASYAFTSNSPKTEIDVTATLDSGGVANPSVNLITTKKTFIAAALHSGHDAVSSLTPAAGHTRDGVGVDFGLQTADYIRRTASPVVPGTYATGWTATSEEAGILAVAIRDSFTPARFYGEVSDWPQEWTRVSSVTGCAVTGVPPFNDAGVSLVANGITRRLSQGQAPLRSAPERFGTVNGAFAYWPLNDLVRAEFGQPSIGDFRFTLQKKGTSAIRVGEGELAPWLANGAQIRNTTLAPVMEGRVEMSATHWMVTWAFRQTSEEQGSSSVWVYDQSADVIWRILMLPASGEISVRLRTGGEGSSEATLNTTSVPRVSDGQLHAMQFETDQNGPNADYKVSIDGIDVIGTLTTAAAITQDGIGKIRIGGSTGTPGTEWSYGHVAAWGDVTGPPQYSTPINSPQSWASAVFGHLGETAILRFARLCTEENIEYRVDTFTDSNPMGPQYEIPLLDLLHECENVDLGVLYEPREFFGLAYRSRVSMSNQPAMATLVYGSDCGLEVRPTDDDQRTRNDIKVNRQDGSSYRVRQLTGPLNVSPPPVGVGIYDDEITADLFADGKPIEDYAGWRLHMGTVDEPRFPDVTVVLGSHTGPCNATTSPQTMQLDVGDRFLIDNLPWWIVVDDADQLSMGFVEELTLGLHVYGLNAVPASPFNVLVYGASVTGSGGTNKLDTDGSVIALAASSSVATLQVATTQGPPWTTDDLEFPFDVRAAGERVTVTDIVPAAAQTMQAGTAAHADNASVVPGLPASVQADDLLLILAAIRNTAAQVNPPTGYTRLGGDATDHFQLFGKIAGSSESAPTVTFSGGVAGDTTSAQVARFRSGLWFNLNNVIQGRRRRIQGSQQNINFLDLNVELPMSLVILCAWKQDDWTTVTDPTSGTVIGSNPTTVGNDQATYWSFRQPTTAPDQTNPNSLGQLIIAGGVAAISKSILIAIHEDRQQFAVTRSVNGVVKAQAVGAPVSLWRPVSYGL